MSKRAVSRLKEWGSYEEMRICAISRINNMDLGVIQSFYLPHLNNHFHFLGEKGIKIGGKNKF